MKRSLQLIISSGLDNRRCAFVSACKCGGYFRGGRKEGEIITFEALRCLNRARFEGTLAFCINLFGDGYRILYE